MDTQGKTTHVQYFDNGLSDNSDEEIETVNHLTYVNKVQPVRSEPKTQTSVSRKTEHRNKIVYPLSHDAVYVLI